MQHRFVESRLTLSKEQIEKIVPGATYAMSVELYFDTTFTGSVTVVCDGMMAKAVTSYASSMRAFKGTAFTFRVDSRDLRGQRLRVPVNVTIYSASQIHVKEVNLRGE